MNQRNVPGIDDAYLAMDTEEGVEVVWNEVMISERKNFQQLEVGLSAIIVSGSQMLALGDVAEGNGVFMFTLLIIVFSGEGEGCV